jgi:hypothetical protein
MSGSTGLASRGGSIVAVDACASGDAKCAGSSVAHDFADFTVSYPPNPGSGRADLQATFSGRYLWISDADCGLFTFDVVTTRWYGHDAADMTALISQTGSPAVVKTPPSVSGAAALKAAAPASTGDCQL